MNKRRVKIKKLPNNKRKVRIIKNPSTDYTLPSNVGYAGAVYPVFAYGGYLPMHQTQGVVGGINTPHDKSIVGALTGNLGNPIDIQAQDNITFNPTGTGMPTNPYEAADPYMTNVQVNSAIDDQEENREAKESGEYTQDFRAVRDFSGDAYNLQVNRLKNIGSGIKERQERGEIMEAYNAGNYDRSSRDEGSDTLDLGDYQSNTGDFRLADKGPKSLGRYVKGQMGGSLPKAQTGLQGKAKKKYDQGVVTRTKDKSKVKDMTKLEGTDNVYYTGKEGTSREIKRSSGTSKFQGSDDQYSKNICEAMKNGAYKGVSAEEMAKKGKISTGRIAEFKACENIEPDKVDVVEIFEEEEVTTDDTPKTTENCNCPNDAEGEATGTIVTKEDGTQECECEETTTEGMAQPKQPGEAGYLLQDSMGTTQAAINKSKLKTFLPAMNQVDLEEKEAVFLDPLAAQRANQAAAQATQQVIGSQAGSNTNRLIAAQAAAADNAAKIDADIANKNVQIAGNIGASNVDTRNKESMLNAQNRKQYMDDYTRAMQAGINADIAYSGALTAKQQQALERKWKIDAMNQQNEQFNMDPVSGGRIYATGVERATSPERPRDLTQSLEKYNKYVDDDAAVRLAIYEDKINRGSQGYGGKDLSGLMSLYGRSNQKGGPIYEHGGQHKIPFGTTNVNQILPPGYSDYYNGGDVIPNASQTTRTIGAVPREDANLEAEGGEVVYGDINGDTFPEVNTIVGPRHAQGGVPLNLPDDTFIFSDYKTGGMKISDPEVLKMFGKSGKKKKGSRKKPSYTPAELAKQYDINKYRAILEDPNSDNISRRTAELMIENYNMKLGGLAIAQESSKGFPQGIPMVARPYMEANGISEEDLIPPPPPQPQQMAMQGGQMMPQQPMTGAPEIPQQGMMRYGGWHY
jgi:hypothetical protein